MRRKPRQTTFAALFWTWVGVAALAIGAASAPASAQQTPANPQNAPATAPGAASSQPPASSSPFPQIPPVVPPPPNAVAVPPPPIAPARPAPPAPATVVVPAGTRIAVALDTPLSTRISKTGQLVHFRTSEAVPVAGGLTIPPDTLFSGKVIRAQRPGAFGKSGALGVNVERIELGSGAGMPVAARIDATDPEANGRPTSDHSRKASLLSLALWTGQGALLGDQIMGGKGAATGAGAGAAIALLMMMSKHGQDVYLEPGTPFEVVLNQSLILPGPALLATPVGSSEGSPASGNSGTSAGAENPASISSVPSTDPSTDPDRPKLKHRPKLDR